MPLTPIEPSNLATTQCFGSLFCVFTRYRFYFPYEITTLKHQQKALLLLLTFTSLFTSCVCYLCLLFYYVGGFFSLLEVKFDGLISLGKVTCFETGDLMVDYIMYCCDKMNWNFERLVTTNLHTKGRDVTVRNGNENDG